jgi:Transposase DDE domain
MDFKTSIQRELDKFYKISANEEFSIRKVTKGAFSQARSKVDPYAFTRLNEIAVDGFYAEAPWLNWLGHRLLSCDGSRLALPKHASIAKEFGEHGMGPKADCATSLALCSLLYDPLNLVTLDSQIDKYASSERDLLLKHLDKTRPGDLLLLDRGYPCFWLFFLLMGKGVEFCVRMKEHWWLDVDDFANSDETDRVVSFKLPKKDYDKLADFKDFTERTIQCRLIKVALETGETEILCTSLLDPVKYPAESFGALYHLRWNQEEAYKLLKCRAELENFSGKTALAVRQDFHAKIFSMTLCAIYAHPIEQKVRAEFKADKARKHDQKINRTSALSMLQSILVPVFIKRQFKKAIAAFDDIVYKTRELIRPDRKNERKHKPKRQYHMNYKRL